MVRKVWEKQDVAVFRYLAINRQREDHEESGTVVARDEQEAMEKLRGLNLGEIRLKRMGSIAGFFRSLTADIK